MIHYGGCMEERKIRIETELEVRSYIQNLRYALKNGAKLNFQICFHIESDRR